MGCKSDSCSHTVLSISRPEVAATKRSDVVMTKIQQWDERSVCMGECVYVWGGREGNKKSN